jgi:hypothetical protein
MIVVAGPGLGRLTRATRLTRTTLVTEASDSIDWEKEIGAMTLFVPDLGRAREFYQAAFGLDAQVMDDDTATGAGARQRVPATRLVRRAGISPVSR